MKNNSEFTINVFIALFVLQFGLTIVNALPVTNTPKMAVVQVPAPPPFPPTNSPRPAIAINQSLAIPPILRTVTFAWDNPSNAAIVSWNLYQLTPLAVLMGSATTNLIAVSNVNMVVTNTFALTAVDVFSNESAMSAPVNVSNPSAPFNFRPVKYTP